MVFLLFMKTPVNTIIAVAMVYIPVNAVYLLAKSNINHFDLTLPIARKDIVNYRYMSTFVYAIVGGALVALILKAIGFDVSLLDLEFALQSTLWLSIVFFH
ncbi:ABC-2 transporter permease [Nosocomiicoccus ampullae]|nr:ABC-2 transporter permease [Nosocomiicoccus ampullae]MDK6863086.1 ABC-2 transporter permease [Nosocomiicoccus ampullae]